MIDLDNDALNERDGRESARKKRPENASGRESVCVRKRAREGWSLEAQTGSNKKVKKISNWNQVS